LEPTFGGIRPKDIKAPECFTVERKLRERTKFQCSWTEGTQLAPLQRFRVSVRIRQWQAPHLQL
jgi:hypothetical protein